MKVFPHFLVRIGGGPIDHLKDLQFQQITRNIGQLIDLQKKREEQKIIICELLLNHIRRLADHKIQNTLQNIRRDIFNDRNINQRDLEKVQQSLNADIWEKIEDFFTLKADILQMSNEIKRVYNDNLYKARCKLQELAGHDNLQKGLILSTRTLLDSVWDYQKKDPLTFRKREFQTEYSLLKYLTRMYTKTSPFSTFNNLALGMCLKQNKGAILFGALQTKSEITSHIRVNNKLFKYLTDLFVSSKEIYQRLLLRLNPTLIEKNDHFKYLTNHNNSEAFQRIPANPVISIIIKKIQEQPNGIRFDELIHQIQSYVDASPDDLENFLVKLTNFGLLEFNLQISGTDPDWNLKLVEKLQPLVDEGVMHIAQLIDCLKSMHSLTQAYATASVNRRIELLDEAFLSFREVCFKIHEAAGLPASERKTSEELSQRLIISEKKTKKQRQLNDDIAIAEPDLTQPVEKPEKIFQHRSYTFFHFTPEQMFYEDTTREVVMQIDTELLEPLVEKLRALLTELKLFKGNVGERQLMEHYFIQKYEKHAHVSLLTFYEDYFRDVKKPGPGKEETVEPPQKTQGHLKAISKWYEECVKSISPRFSEDRSKINILLSDLEKVNQAVDYKIDLLPATSYGAFVQFYEEEDEKGNAVLKAVLNASFAGFGKMMSRFMHIFPPYVTEDLKYWNLTLMDDQSIFIENCDASFFNANLHPSLMPFEMRVPGGHNNLTSDHQLPVSDFELYLDDKDQLTLQHRPSQKKAYVFDLGFQAGGRSQLFQLLDKFSKVEFLTKHHLVNPLNKAVVKTAEQNNGIENNYITVFPRIVYEEQIILQRKSWQIPKILFPVRKPLENDADYYLAIDMWRNELAIPEEVFIYINPYLGVRDGDNKDIEPDKAQRLGRDDNKPQYIHFENPLLVNLFEKLVNKAPAALRIEEMLPTSQQLTAIGDKQFVAETLLQWYTT